MGGFDLVDDTMPSKKGGSPEEMSLVNMKIRSAKCTLSVEIRDTVGPATFDYLQRAQEKAQEKGCASILVRINTPGGSLQSTRKIVEQIMASPIPYLCIVHPSGGHAGSAGAIIMQACHINGAMEATNLGAASPINGNGKDIPKDLRKKIFEDTRSWVEGLAKYRGRSEKFAKEIIEDAKALDADAALKADAIDVVVTDLNQFVAFAAGKPVRLNSEEMTPVTVGPIEVYEPDLRHDILQITSNPQWTYLIFMGSLGLLYFEMTHPGTILPGVVGLVGLVFSMINFHLLDVQWGGVVLLFLGMAFMFAEAFVPSFGALGLGGLASFIVGSIFLFDEKSGYEIPLGLLISTSLALAILMFGITYLAVTATKRGLLNREKEKMEGQTLTVREFDSKKMKGIGFFKGELWKIKSEDDLAVDDTAKIHEVQGLTLLVKKNEENV